MKHDEKEYQFGRCLWAQQTGSSSFSNGHCQACDNHIVDIRGSTREQFDAVYRESEGKLCVQCSSSQFVTRGMWLKYAACFAVGILPFSSGCGTTADLQPSQTETVDSSVDPDDVFIGMIVEQMPEIVGGIAALQEKLRYPEDAREAGVEGRVIVQLVVDEQGDPQECKD